MEALRMLRMISMCRRFRVDHWWLWSYCCCWETSSCCCATSHCMTFNCRMSDYYITLEHQIFLSP